jgi:hypothetical protein
VTDPPAGTPVVPLARAWPSRRVRSTAPRSRSRRAGNELFYRVDNAALDSPPLSVHEGEVETCRVATGGT